MQAFILSAYTKGKEGELKKKTPSVFLLGHVSEPLAKIIIYEGKERRGETGGWAIGFLLSWVRWSSLRQLED